MGFCAGQGLRNTLFPICLSPVRSSRGRTAGKCGQTQPHQKLQYKETARWRQRRLGRKESLAWCPLRVAQRIRLGELAVGARTRAILPEGRARMNQPRQEAAAQLKREHATA